MWNDGYGDQSLEESDEAILAGYERWLYVVVSTYVRHYEPDFNDFRNEARLAMWKTLQKHRHEPALPAFLTNAAEWRLKDLFRGRPFTGHVNNHNNDDPYRKPQVALRSVEAMRKDPDSEDELEAALGHVLIAEGVIMAYHHGQIAHALDALTPRQREYVELRFWRGMEHPELEAHFGYNPGSLWSAKKDGARVRLARELAHLGA